jgi:hypothetical protein
MITNREAGVVHERREQLVEEIRMAERARDLLARLERLLKDRDRSDLEEHLGRLERLAGSLPEAHPVRLLAESAVGSARARGAGYAGSAASRARSKTEGRLSTLRGSLSRWRRSRAWTRSEPLNEGGLSECLGPSSRPYSPECVEGEFSDVRIDGVLGSSC